MIYVIEGLDRCGKTTFVNLLRKYLTNPKVMTIHSGKPPKDVDCEKWSLDHYNNLIDQCIYLNSKGYDIILDRSWLGETIYGPIYRSTNLSMKQLETNITGFESIFTLCVFLDNAESALKRDDGLSLSVDVKKKEYEIASFKTAFGASVVKSKYMFDWSIIDFSEYFLENCAVQLVHNGAICKESRTFVNS